MPRIAYVNGRYLPHAHASVHIEDRALQFSDGVYEVIAVRDGRLKDLQPHLQRLHRSLAELHIQGSMRLSALELVFKEVIRRNRVENGIIYVQISRGVSPRDHAFPQNDVQPGVIVTAQRQDISVLARRNATGVKVITLPDLRWKRRDIKSVSLIGNVLAKQAAKEAGAFEAWMTDDQGLVTEGSSTNAWIVNEAGEIMTRHAGNDILSGITRDVVLEVARQRNLRLLERGFTVAQAKSAREAFLTSTTALVLPVIQIDECVIGEGRPGPVAQALYDALALRWQTAGTA